MYKSIRTMVALAVVTAVTLAQGAKTRAADDIVDTAVKAGSFKTLAAALGAADLVGALKGKGPFTVFAPTDDAFARFDRVLGAGFVLEGPDGRRLGRETVLSEVRAAHGTRCGRTRAIQRCNPHSCFSPRNLVCRSCVSVPVIGRLECTSPTVE